MSRSPVDYASPRTTTVPIPRIGVGTVCIAAWVLLILWQGYLGFWGLLNDQIQLARNMDRVTPGGDIFSELIGTGLHSAGIVVYAFFFGAISSVVLWHWRRSRLIWVLAIPGLAGVWNFALLISATGFAETVPLSWLFAAFVIQGGLIYAGTQFGRAFFTLVVRLLLPADLQPLLISLWSGR